MTKKVCLQPMKPAMLPEMNRIYNAIFANYFFRPMRLERDFAASYVRENQANALVALHGKKVVAHAVAKPAGLKIECADLGWASLGNVMTLPEYREMGIASRMNAKLFAKLRKEGVDGVYISGDRGLYTRAGATSCGAYVNFEVSAKAPTSGVTVRRCTMADVQELVKLQAREKTGFVRSSADFQSVLKDGVAFLSHASAWMISNAEGPLAWVVLRPSWGERKKERPRHGAVVDYAGSRAVLAAGLDHCMLELGYTSLTAITVSVGDRELRWILEQRGLKGTFDTGGGTQLILDPLRLLGRLQPYIQGRIGADEEQALRFARNAKGFEFTHGKSRLRLKDLNELTVLLFGEEPQRWSKLLPGRGRLAGLLRQVFPLPFPILGLNWN